MENSMNTRTKVLPLFLTAALVFGQMSTAAFAVEDAPRQDGVGTEEAIGGPTDATDVDADATESTGTDSTEGTDSATDGTVTDGDDAADTDDTDAAVDDPDAAAENDDADDLARTMELLDVSIDGVYTISVNLPTSKVFDIPGGSLNNGAKLQMYTANRTPAQRFQIKPVSDDPGYYTIVSIKSDKALDVPAARAENRASIQQYTPNGTDAQKWAFIPTDAADGTYYIVSKLDPKLCLDVEGASTQNGARLQLYSSNKTPAQRFLLNKQSSVIADGLYTVQSKLASSAVLDVAQGSLASGANVQIYGSNGTFAQKFSLTFDANTGYYTITNSMSNKALDVAGAGTTSGTNVIMYTSNQTPAQKWAIESDGQGNYVLYAACSGLALDVAGGSTRNGTNVQTYAPNGTPAQTWSLLSVRLINDGLYQVRSALGTTLDAASGGTAVGTNVQAYTPNMTLAQRYRLLHKSDNYYIIECLNSGLLVTAIANTSNVQLENAVIDDSKLWRPIAMGDGSISLRNKATGRALDVKNGSSAAGTNVQISVANNTIAQKWNLVSTDPLPDGYYTIASVENAEFVVDMPSASRENGARPQLYRSNDTAAQRFNLTVTTSGSYTITAMCSSKNFDVASGAIDTSGNGILQQYSPNGTNAQKWRIEYVGNGEFTVFSLLKNTSCITVKGSAATSAALSIATHTGAVGQRFVFRAASGIVFVPYSITLDQMAGYQKNGNPYLINVSLADIRNALDPSKVVVDPTGKDPSPAQYQFADLRSYSGLSARQINNYLSSTESGRSGILNEQGAAFVKASQQYGINECFLVAHAVNETGWGTSELSKGYYYDGKTAIGGTYYPAGTYYNFFGIGAYDSSPLAGGRSMAIQNGWNTPEKAILGGADWIGKYYIYASAYPQSTAYDIKWDTARSNTSHTYGVHQYATDHLWPAKNSRLMNECYDFNDFTPNLHYLIPAYAAS
jgi:beta-N-acetylglucosaminidase